MSLAFESFELLGHDRLLIVTKLGDSAVSTPRRALDCVDLDALFESSSQTLKEYMAQARPPLSGTMPDSVILLRQALPTEEAARAEDGEGGDKATDEVRRQLAVSSGRNIAAVLSRSRRTGMAAGAAEQQRQGWTRQKVEFWDVVAAEEDEEGEDDAMTG